jgi:hypothetical protein
MYCGPYASCTGSYQWLTTWTFWQDARYGTSLITGATATTGYVGVYQPLNNRDCYAHARKDMTFSSAVNSLYLKAEVSVVHPWIHGDAILDVYVTDLDTSTQIGFLEERFNTLNPTNTAGNLFGRTIPLDSPTTHARVEFRVGTLTSIWGGWYYTLTICKRIFT